MKPDSPASSPATSHTTLSTRALVRQFRASMAIDYEKWREGIGYDVDLIRQAGPTGRAALAAVVVPRAVNDWRDVEALAALGTAEAHHALQDALTSGAPAVQMAVLRYAPGLVTPEEREAVLVEALRTAKFYGGLSEALDEVTRFHPPAVIAALLRGTLDRQGDGPVHFAAMLFFLHGQATSAFDWAHRPFFLRFNTANRAERATVFRELCARIGVDPALYLGAEPRST
jgi:hypothetical protein